METLAHYSENSELFEMVHRQDNRPVMQHVKELKALGNNGWTKDRTMQKIGEIPALEYFKMCKINPELKDPNKLEKWLMGWEGAAYRVAEDGRHRCSQIIVK